jgi:hypothetical protein
MHEFLDNLHPDGALARSRGGSRNFRRTVTWMLVAIWSAAVVCGMWLLATYANTAGKTASPPAVLGDVPGATFARHQLVMFLHPRCPCSVASVNELARIMSRCASRLDAKVYFVRSESQPAEWERGRLWNLATAIPGTTVEVDVGGKVATRFRSSTSGEVFVYDRHGKLRFHGGITAARGHAGDNLGEFAVMDVALGVNTNVECSPVFGCPFRAETADSGR